MDKFDFDQLGFPADGSENDAGATRELDSIHGADENSGIASRERFAELNGADEPGSTRMMDSLTPADEPEPQEAPANPVQKRKKRRKKKHQFNHTRTMGHVFLGVVLSAAAICAGVFLAWKVIVGLMDYTGMAKKSREADITITDSMNVDDIADVLHENGIIEMPWLFKAYINYSDKAQGFLDGEYTVNAQMSYKSIVTLLKTVRTYTNTVTVMIPEGSNAQQIGQLLEDNLVCRADDFEKYYRTKLEKYDFEEKIDVTEDRFYALEGYLFPDTYEFYVGMQASSAINKMLDNFNRKITEDMQARLDELGMSIGDIVNVASLIEKEAANDSERSVIASVIYNRLNYDMPLGIDAAVLYPYPEHEGAPTAEMLAKDDPYNTRIKLGLPPTPISNPGIASINAALWPDATDYFYYALDTATGTHQFFTNEADFNNFVATQNYE